VQIRQSARKHGIADEDIAHAFENAVRLVEFETYGEERLLVIRPDRAGHMLELIAMPASQPTRVIHADRLRPKFYDYLR
jgi:uncharacterized DUF497 family protein